MQPGVPLSEEVGGEGAGDAAADYDGVGGAGQVARGPVTQQLLGRLPVPVRRRGVLDRQARLSLEELRLRHRFLCLLDGGCLLSLL